MNNAFTLSITGTFSTCSATYASSVSKTRSFEFLYKIVNNTTDTSAKTAAILVQEDASVTSPNMPTTFNTIPFTKKAPKNPKIVLDVDKKPRSFESEVVVPNIVL